MMDSSAGSAKSGVYSARQLKRSAGFGLFLAVAPFSFPDQPQELPAIEQSGGFSVFTTIPTGALGWLERMAVFIHVAENLVAYIPVKYTHGMNH